MRRLDFYNTTDDTGLLPFGLFYYYTYLILTSHIKTGRNLVVHAIHDHYKDRNCLESIHAQ